MQKAGSLFEASSAASDSRFFPEPACREPPVSRKGGRKVTAAFPADRPLDPTCALSKLALLAAGTLRDRQSEAGWPASRSPRPALAVYSFAD